MAQRQYQLLIYGASGFTGRLVALYLTKHAPATLRWGLAGRNLERLQKVADECKRINPSKDLPIVVGAGDVAAQTNAIVTTAGPYMLYGEPLLKACVEAGTDYCDLTGETLWVHKMIQKYGAIAKKNGCIIVPMSGFDSVPADLGTFFLVREARLRLGARISEATAYIAAKGSISGGTIASALNMAVQPDKGLTSDPFIISPLNDPSYPQPSGASAAGLKQSDVTAPVSDFRWPFWATLFGQYAWFFIMGTINTRVVRRSATIYATEGEKLACNRHAIPALPSTTAAGAKGSNKGSAGTLGPLAYSSGPFGYSEWSLSRSWMTAVSGTLALGLFGFISSLPGGVSLLRRFLPKPGEGPSDETIASNWFQYFIVGKTEEEQPRTVVARVHGRDGGYGDTSMMLAEAGMALALQRSELPGTSLGGGFLTPATAFGQVLVDRLNSANLRFEILPSEAAAAVAARTPGAPPTLGTPSRFAQA